MSNRPPRSRAWCFTYNNYSEDDFATLKDLVNDARYAILGEEVGEQGTPHVQGYVYYNSARARPDWSANGFSPHFEISKGTPLENFTYCSKDGKFWEHGELPASQEEKGDRGADHWNNNLLLAYAGRFVECDARLQLLNWSNLVAAHDRKKAEEVESFDGCFENVWHFGPAGCGKSRGVRKEYPGAYYKSKNKWWSNYKYQATVIIDDWSPETSKFLTDHLKEWSDRYVFNAEVKQSGMVIRPRRIIVTSQYPIDACFPDSESRDAIKRRFRVEEYPSPPPNFVLPPSILPTLVPIEDPILWSDNAHGPWSSDLTYTRPL